MGASLPPKEANLFKLIVNCNHRNPCHSIPKRNLDNRRWALPFLPKKPTSSSLLLNNVVVLRACMMDGLFFVLWRYSACSGKAADEEGDAGKKFVKGYRQWWSVELPSVELRILAECGVAHHSDSYTTSVFLFDNVALLQ